MEKPPSRDTLSSEEIEMAMKGLNQSKTLNVDVLNAWAQIMPMFRSIVKIEQLEPIEKYEDYFKRKEAQSPGLYDYVMSLSSPEAVAALNDLATEFNADLDRIKREKDYGALEKYFERAREIIYK
jgi:hypothetical protein